ncbi:MAG: glyoxalase [Acidobacteria bacterium]|nr:MAG: glyoxalase [Acidobacteriota bacterium]
MARRESGRARPVVRAHLHAARRPRRRRLQRRRTAAVASVIDPRARIGAVHLTISSLDDSIRFYQAHLGFVVHRREERTAWLGAGGADLLVLSACERAPRARGTTGLYHFAVLVPTRADLARAFMRLVETDTLMQGAADHGVSEALYLADVDGNGIEI